MPWIIKLQFPKDQTDKTFRSELGRALNMAATYGFGAKRTLIAYKYIEQTVLINLDILRDVGYDELLEESLIKGATETFWREQFHQDKHVFLKFVLKILPIRESTMPSLELALNVFMRENRQKILPLATILESKTSYRMFYETRSEKGITIRGEEREPGSLLAMSTALVYFHQTTQKKPLSVPIFLQTHKRATTGVIGLREEVGSGRLRESEQTGFGLSFEENYRQGLLEILISPLYNVAFKIRGRRFETLLTGEELEAFLTKLIDSYNREMQGLESPFRRLMRIVEFTQDMIRTHPVGDANGRTLGKIILNGELSHYGLPNTQLEKNIFANYDQLSMTSMLIDGMYRFIQPQTEQEEQLFRQSVIGDMLEIFKTLKITKSSSKRVTFKATSEMSVADYQQRKLIVLDSCHTQYETCPVDAADEQGHTPKPSAME